MRRAAAACHPCLTVLAGVRLLLLLQPVGAGGVPGGAAGAAVDRQGPRSHEGAHHHNHRQVPRQAGSRQAGGLWGRRLLTPRADESLADAANGRWSSSSSISGPGSVRLAVQSWWGYLRFRRWQFGRFSMPPLRALHADALGQLTAALARCRLPPPPPPKEQQQQQQQGTSSREQAGRQAGWPTVASLIDVWVPAVLRCCCCCCSVHLCMYARVSRRRWCGGAAEQWRAHPLALLPTTTAAGTRLPSVMPPSLPPSVDRASPVGCLRACLHWCSARPLPLPLLRRWCVASAAC